MTLLNQNYSTKMGGQPDDRKEERTGNSGFALWGLTSFVETFVQGSTFLLRMNSSAKNPPQRKAAKRYQQA